MRRRTVHLRGMGAAVSIVAGGFCMTLHALKPRFQTLLRPIARRIFERGGNANSVTVATGAGSLLVGAILSSLGQREPTLFVLLPAWLLARMALNAVDGMLAREHG